jgi:hypothetical protein
MNQLDDHTRRALCAADQPPAGVEDRILAAILGPIGGPGSDGGLGSAPAPASGSLGAFGSFGSLTLVHAAKVVGATLGLAAGGLALLAVTAAGVRGIGDQPSARVEAPQPEVVASAAVDPPLEDQPIETPETVDEDPSPAPAIRPIQKPSKPAPPQSEGTIEAELALMKTARSSKDHQRALAALDRHRQEFATGVFAAEREVLRVEHLCALGRRSEAERVAAKFLASYPDDPLRSRVEPACAK